MLLQKSGEMNLMIINVIFGVLVVLFMKWQVKSHLLGQQIWMVYIKEFKKVNMKEFQLDILMTFFR